MAVVAYSVAFLITILLCCFESETTTTVFITEPSNPTFVEEGKIFTLEWNYTIDGTVFLAQFFNVTGGGNVRLAKTSETGNIVTAESDYIGRFSGQVTNTKAELIVLGMQRSEQLTCRFLLNPTGSGMLSSDVEIIVQVPSNITRLSGKTVIEGENVKLECVAEGKPTPNISWARLSDNRDVVMPLTNISRWDAGLYRCTARNGVGSPATGNVLLVVQYKPDHVSLNMSTTKVCAGMEVTFTCSGGSANPPIQNYTLYKFDSGLTSSSQDGVFKQRLHTKGLHNYRCEASNSVGSTSSSNRILEVHVPASVTIENDTIVVLEGRNVTLHCLSCGFPSPNVSWTDFSNYTVEEGSILKFQNISRRRHGSYTCSATNACGSDRKKVDIVVEYPLEINGSGQNATVAGGVKHTFSCPVDGNPEPHIEWYNEKTGTKISSEKLLETRESGCYTCVASNDVGPAVSVTQCLTINAFLTTVPLSTVSPGGAVEGRVLIVQNYSDDYQNMDSGPSKEFVAWFVGEMDKIYMNMPEYHWTQVKDLRPGSVIVNFILHFKIGVTREKGLENLRVAISSNGTFGGIEAKYLSGESTTSTTPAKPKPAVSVSAGPPWAIIGAVAGGVVLLTISVGVFTWWVHKQRECRQDTKIPNPDLGRQEEEGGYSLVQGAYAQSGPPVANGTDGAAAEQQLGATAIPTYAAVDKSKKKKKLREVPPVYAEVDKSKKKKKKIDERNLYETLDEPKKAKIPGELLYADLGDFQNRAVSAVSISPQPLPAIKKPEAYERTDYADIAQFLKGNTTSPQNGGNEDTEWKPERPSKKKIQGKDNETQI